MTTKRASLTPKERREMYGKQGRRCYSCQGLIVLDGCIAEHTHPVALGNDQKPDCLLCIPCADRKTNGGPATTYGSDSHETAKAARQEGQRLLREGASPEDLSERQRKSLDQARRKQSRQGKIQSRGFDARYRKRMDGTVEKK